jgi:uncharacterized protein YggE
MVHRIPRTAALAVVLWSVLAAGTVAGLAPAENVTPQVEQGNTSQEGANDTTTATITVTATEEAEAEPDAAIVFLGVRATADSPDAAARTVANNTSRLRAALANASIDEDAIRTTNYDLYELDRRESGNETDRYVAEQGIAVEINDTDRAGEIVDLAVENGATNVRGVQFTLSDETRSELRNRALSNAVASAGSQAEAIAGSADLRVVGVDSVSTVETTFGPLEATAERAVREDAATRIDAGPLTVTATVQVTYNATSA